MALVPLSEQKPESLLFSLCHVRTRRRWPSAKPEESLRQEWKLPAPCSGLPSLQDDEK